MTEQFRPSADFYQQHTSAVRAAFDGAMDAAGADTVVVFSGALRYAFLDDISYPFQANPHFMYWLPVTEVPDSYIIYQRGETPILAYCQPDDYWHSLPEAPDPYWAEHFDVRITRSAADARSHLPEMTKSPILIGEIQDASQALGIDRINPRAALHWLDIARTAKSDYEITLMREASRLGAIAHSAAADAFGSGSISEYTLHQAYLNAINYVDTDLPYHSIVGLNEHAAVLHYQHRDRQPPAELRTFLIDAGASCHGYASDITRTYATQQGLFADLLTGMETLQQEVCSRVVSGADYRQLHNETHTLLAELLVATEIGRGSAEGLVESGISRALLPHGLGHYLGLQVHDVGGHLADAQGTPTERPATDPNLRLTRTLGDNEVLTIEPGVYFIDMLLAPVRASRHAALLNWDAIDTLMPFGGIRIEDNVRVNGNTPENLTRKAFASLS
ncbi:MAG: Xaa-Pro dipeptidase [Pseudomonadota bacterium]